MYSPISRWRRRFRFILTICVIAAIIGAIYGTVVTYIVSGNRFEWLGLPRGIVTGILIAGTISLIEVFIVDDQLGEPIRRLPFLVVLVLKTLLYSGLILAGDALGEIIVPIETGVRVGANSTTLITLLMSLGITSAFMFLLQISQLLGPGVLGKILRGSYHQPRREERLFLFIDLRRSTAIAEAIGDIAFHRFLDRFLFDAGNAIAAHGGEVHKYVGDEVIATWSMTPDALGRALEAITETRANIARRSGSYTKQFGQVPAFRAVLHAGMVVIGELGDVKREIAMLGDTINTTAKIEQSAKALPHETVASAQALSAGLPARRFKANSLGPVMLPGKAHAIELFAIEALS